MARPPNVDNRRSAEGRCRSWLARSSPGRGRLAFRHHVGLRQPLALVRDRLAIAPRGRQRRADARSRLALASGPAIRRSSAALVRLFSRTTTTGWSPSNKAALLPLVELQSTRRPSKFVAPPTSTPNSVRVATDEAAAGSPAGSTGTALSTVAGCGSAGGMAAGGWAGGVASSAGVTAASLTGSATGVALAAGGATRGGAAAAVAACCLIDPVTSSRLRSSVPIRAAKRSRSAVRLRTASANRRVSASVSDGRVAGCVIAAVGAAPP